ncbi:30S ribosomal protein S4 [Candidatus Shapirobacteria bacterium CG09_land_8_20_14_0_10_49_15]|uniref:Small ribosomal subunit protein uS4 n=2 Tax=Candidatus Shapironibacteriota TaxID=1752721 RepID=A0A2M8L6S8_9BACT|nr:MAG: 30S ribosomal protein S4 [Candidatus Shapirobacteria bacterium CG09_land_8_20_14_0_10_49_15]PJE69939.1 MAG: 30S ribosomal protein S4 [Candidatus Shapirobacteria bacterium CG10_big_fil_rev_8_21_14_0_10_48_15]
MARLVDAKCRRCRREGVKLFLKGERCYSAKCPIDKKGAVPPGEHGAKRRRRPSDYGLQLREKQKVKRLYGVLERQFRRYFNQARKVKAMTGEVLLQLLETRLDNVTYRLGLAASRSISRQLVSHGFIQVNGKKVNIPSYQARPGDVISLVPAGLNLSRVKESLADKDRKVSSWLQRKAVIGKILRLPKREEIEADIDENLIVEYYSR